MLDAAGRDLGRRLGHELRMREQYFQQLPLQWICRRRSLLLGANFAAARAGRVLVGTPGTTQFLQSRPDALFAESQSLGDAGDDQLALDRSRLSGHIGRPGDDAEQDVDGSAPS